MFWGATIKEGQPFESRKVFEEHGVEYPVLHLSAAILEKPTQSTKVKLYVTGGENDGWEVAYLRGDVTNLPAVLSLLINRKETVTLMVIGSRGAQVNLSGYFQNAAIETEDAEEGEDEQDEQVEEIEEVKQEPLVVVAEPPVEVV